MPGGGQGAPAGGAVEAPSRPETRRPGGQLGPRRTGPSGRLGKAAREHPGQGPLPLPPGEAFGPGLLKGAEGRVPGAERRELAHFAHTQRDPRLSAHSPGLYTPLPKADWKKNVFGTWGSAALEKAGSDSSRKAVQAGSSLTPSHPASTTPVPAAKTPLQAGLRRPGVLRISILCAQNSRSEATPVAEREGAAATSPRLLKVKMEAKALGSKTGILSERS